jgi:uncharacterized protein (DUF302 family)
MDSFGMHKEVRTSFDDALVRVSEALKSEGFGVLTEIDVQATLKKKLDVNFRRYKILGACNPPFAYRALEASLDVGLLLPCNVVVYEKDPGTVHIAAVDPLETVAARGGEELEGVAREVHDKLARVIDRIG